MIITGPSHDHACSPHLTLGSTEMLRASVPSNLIMSSFSVIGVPLECLWGEKRYRVVQKKEGTYKNYNNRGINWLAIVCRSKASTMFIFTYMQKHMYTFIQMLTVHTRSFTRTCTPTCIHVHVHAHTRMHTHTHTHMHTHMHTHTHTYMHRHTHTHTCTHAHTHTHTHTHKPVLKRHLVLCMWYKHQRGVAGWSVTLLPQPTAVVKVCGVHGTPSNCSTVSMETDRHILQRQRQ